MDYKPLCSDGSDIRVLQIITDTNPAHGMVHCRLKHIQFKKSTFKAGEPRARRGQWIPSEQPGVIELEPKRTGAAATDSLWDPSKVPDEPATASSKIDLSADEIWQRGAEHVLVEDGDFAALSYVWGDPSKTKGISVDGNIVQVTENLEAALRQLRGRLPWVRKQEKDHDEEGEKESIGIWVDALCINQNDLAERSREVARMRDIYASAWEVVTWLGPASADSDLAMVAVEWLSGRVESGRGLEGFYRETKTVDLRPLFIKWSRQISPMRKQTYRALYDLFARPYWRRLWILQEIALASPSSAVICGSRGVTWRHVFRAAALIQADECRLGWDVLEAAGSKFGGFDWDFTADRLPSGHTDTLSSEKLWKLLLEIEILQEIQHSSSPIETPNVLRTLSLSRDAQATNEKDKVYGILGLRSILGASQITPDYNMATTDIFRQFAQAMFSSGHLSGLRLLHSPIGQVQGSHETLSKMMPAKWKSGLLGPSAGYVDQGCSHGMPSWVPCWACPRTPVMRLPAHYRASGDMISEVTFDSSGTRMTVQGIFLGEVSSMSAFHCHEADQSYPLSRENIVSAYGDASSTREAFWRTLVANSTTDGELAPDTYSLLLDPRLWQDEIAGVKSRTLGLADFMQRNQDLVVFNQTLQDLVRHPPPSTPTSAHTVSGKGKWSSSRSRLYNPSREQRDAASLAMNILAWRRLVTTCRGFLGLVPAATKPEDKIFIILGCNCPLVLRTQDSGYRVVGECYVHGFMDGETIQTIEQEPQTLRVVELH